MLGSGAGSETGDTAMARVWASKGSASVLTALGVCASLSAHASDAPGITATEITIGQTMPYSGPVVAFSALGKGEVAYFNMINDQGGVNGRKIKLISLDDGYAPPKTVEATRRLVEQDKVRSRFEQPVAGLHRVATRLDAPDGRPRLFGDGRQGLVTVGDH